MKNTIYKYFFYEFVIYFIITLFALAVLTYSMCSSSYVIHCSPLLGVTNTTSVVLEIEKVELLKTIKLMVME